MYFLSRHAPGRGQDCGIAPDLIQELLVDIETAPLDEKMASILRYARKLTMSPSRVTEVDAARTMTPAAVTTPST